jgi:hypothetical protein
VSGSPARAWQFHSFIGVNPLQTTWPKRGIVSGRVALLPRSAEIQPPFHRFSDWIHKVQSPHSPTTLQNINCLWLLEGALSWYASARLHQAASVPASGCIINQSSQVKSSVELANQDL